MMKRSVSVLVASAAVLSVVGVAVAAPSGNQGTAADKRGRAAEKIEKMVDKMEERMEKPGNVKKVLQTLRQAVKRKIVKRAGSSGSVGSTGSAASAKARGKVIICHKGKTAVIAAPAWMAHKKHGDTQGACAAGSKASKSKSSLSMSASSLSSMSASSVSSLSSQSSSVMSSMSSMSSSTSSASSQ